MNSQELSEQALTEAAYLSLAHKLHDQRSLLLDNQQSELFEGTNQNILATLRKPTSIKEWNDLTAMMLSAERQQAD